MNEKKENYPLIKYEIENYNNIKSYCITNLKENYIFPEFQEKYKETKKYSLNTWKKFISLLNWNY